MTGQSTPPRTRGRITMKKLIAITLAIVAALTLSACTEADRVNENLAKAAEQFEIERRIVGINGITGEYLIEVIGFCSVEASTFYEIICKDEDGDYSRHLIGHSDNTTMVVEQLEAVATNPYQPRVIFRPEEIVPAFELDASWREDG